MADRIRRMQMRGPQVDDRPPPAAYVWLAAELVLVAAALVLAAQNRWAGAWLSFAGAVAAFAASTIVACTTPDD